MELIGGMIISLLAYLALPDVDLTKIQTVLIVLVGWLFGTAIIFGIQEMSDRREARKKNAVD